MYGMGYGGFGPEILLVIFAMILSVYAQGKVQSTFNKYLKVISGSGYTGSEVARKILDRNGLYNVPIEMTPGRLSDHYDPSKRVLRLSSEVYNGRSVASLGVAAHEVGHAIQHANNYAPLSIRNSIAPMVIFGSKFVFAIIFLGFMLRATGLIQLGILIYVGIVAFQLITLPVEFDASKRAIVNLQNGIISQSEVEPAKKVLSAAALTYVAATLVSIAELLRLIGISRRND
ncbi:putative membrane zinc metallopeptidase [Gottschalkia acidurici 9a]|uniref:Membrane zinc metallopeptidase n=1 Tax=Gottschalkia acidurici (strain ATCC 7906 / DSM 604 / BCRC 14475 / CIP 104303 / KCTC 5404 / NCIMB 10678 / 9a) TaxID=1128398 RepID=K0AZJ2_GOTA9|nr:zinc metallopeptidase [Gottschalkia acidurici]AFS78689.1 putative membrane zinc metallopeptidase [Gottschalkia acidurici 9a]